MNLSPNVYFKTQMQNKKKFYIITQWRRPNIPQIFFERPGKNWPTGLLGKIGVFFTEKCDSFPKFQF